MDLDKWYVRFETAWLLKAKGFNEYCEWGYINTGGVMALKGSMIGMNNKAMYSNFCTAPLQSEVLRWLDAKSIFISVSPVFEFNEDREDYLELQGFSYYISYYPNGILDLTDIGDCNVYPTREDALENGILCVLKSTLI